jgi:PKHD-type hydroxylase
MLLCIPDVLEFSELKEIRDAIDDHTFKDGKQTAGYRAKRVKNNLQMDRDAPGAQKARGIVLAALKRNREFQETALPRTVKPPLISRYGEGMNYGWHVDDALMAGDPKIRSDISLTVFLNSPEDYEGGELVISSPFGEQEVKLPAGAAVVYPSATLHQVAPVTAGERLAAVTWARSYVRDAAHRELLADLLAVQKKLAAIAPDEPETDLAFKSYSNLLRMWSE